MSAKAKEYMHAKEIRGLSAMDEEIIGKAIVRFEELDVNNDKALSKRELRKIIPAGLNVESVMSTLDKNQDGKVTLDEFMAGIILVKVENLYRPIFNSFDKDKDGHIELEDLLQVMAGKGYSKEAIRNFIQEGDLDNDGKLSYDEFIKYFFHLQKKN